jgi:hypothetical protein
MLLWELTGSPVGLRRFRETILCGSGEKVFRFRP